jgi:hypothetical protein
MPILTDPRAKIRYVLLSDRDRAENEQAVFMLKVLSTAQWKELSKLSDEFEKATNGEQTLDCAIEIIKTVFSGVENLADFSMEKIEEFLTPSEITELMQACIAQQVITVDDRKKSGSQLLSDSANSANPAKE